MKKIKILCLVPVLSGGYLNAQTSIDFNLGAPLTDPSGQPNPTYNELIFESGGLRVKMTAWSVPTSSNGGSNFSAAEIVQWEPGSGVKSDGEFFDGSDFTTFYVDNHDRVDFLLFQFDSPVQVNGLELTTSSHVLDLDTSHWLGNVTGGFNLANVSPNSLSS